MEVGPAPGGRGGVQAEADHGYQTAAPVFPGRYRFGSPGGQ